MPVKNSIKFAAFYDQGWGKVIQQNISAHHNNFFQSIGTGLRIYLGKFSTVNLDIGIPLGEKRYDGQNCVKFHFSITSDLL